MKKIILLLGVFVFMLFSCENTNNGLIEDKTTKQETNKTSLEASKTDAVKIGEPVMLLVNNASSTTVQWDVMPTDGSMISEQNDAATVVFAKSGVYSVTSTLGKTQLSKKVTVTDSVYTPPARNEDVAAFKKDEKFQINYVINDSSSVGKSDVVVCFILKTENKYASKQNHITTHRENDVNYLDGVYIPKSQSDKDGEKQATGSFVVLTDSNSRSNKLQIMHNQILYEGYFYVANKMLYVNWKHDAVFEFMGAEKY